ncbi:MAG: DUF3332 domain-containing protein [Candidatus Cloacimonetes bacterium]|nr:DUF3332 domain-containing protein [Candidatus Cloacimonadota bacterium]
MKKIRVTSLAFLLIGIILLSGCYGNFSLTRKVYEFNGGFEDKFINSAVFWVFNIIPVYSAAGFVDTVFLNLIEFWTGENPVVFSNTGDKVQYTELDGKIYQITSSQNFVEFAEFENNEVGKTIAIEFNPMTKSWNLVSNEKSYEIGRMDKNDLTLIYPNGKEEIKSLILH